MKTIFENELIRVESTGRDYDFIATVENKTDKKIRVHYKDMDLLDTYDTIDVEPNDWVGLLADEEGYDLVQKFELGQIEVGILEKEMEQEMCGLECPLGGDETNDCADCSYSCDYHFVNGECVRREENK